MMMNTMTPQDKERLYLLVDKRQQLQEQLIGLKQQVGELQEQDPLDALLAEKDLDGMMADMAKRQEGVITSVSLIDSELRRLRIAADFAHTLEGRRVREERLQDLKKVIGKLIKSLEASHAAMQDFRRLNGELAKDGHVGYEIGMVPVPSRPGFEQSLVIFRAFIHERFGFSF